MFSGFSWEPVYRHYHFARRLCVLSGSASDAYFTTSDLPTPFNGLFRQPAAVSLLRPRFTHTPSNGMFTVSAIRSASRLPVRSRLTLTLRTQADGGPPPLGPLPLAERSPPPASRKDPVPGLPLAHSLALPSAPVRGQHEAMVAPLTGLPWAPAWASPSQAQARAQGRLLQRGTL